ncbi:hypothetical protein G5714_020481 [Onychostoma macrolepis]|uniref:Uncharacterized protein n=1 Tax=Onychostoma macrolepis TaxID=369639 RepID=A0A7J6BUN0_9TELE|nr:hypothetical protein G5714_020481 [Onychostoma macrolepis]
MVSAKECPPQNVGGLFWHSAPGGGGLEVVEESCLGRGRVAQLMKTFSVSSESPPSQTPPRGNKPPIPEKPTHLRLRPSPSLRDVGELFPGKCGRPLANRTPHPPAKPGHCRQGPPMSNKKGPLLLLRQREDETDTSVFLFLHLSPDAHRRKKKKEREEGKQSVAFWGVPPPTPPSTLEELC